MKTYPLIRTKWSNEYIMAGLFGTIILYLIPQWVNRPYGILEFISVLALGLSIDVAANFIRYKRPICSVSAAVTSAILFTLTPGVPLWGRLLGITAALVVGKQVWGGTGKNPINPAVTGVLLLSIIFRIDYPVLEGGLLLLPAALVSLLFISFRTFAATGFIAGMFLAFSINGQLSATPILIYGVLFWGCLIMTDPVTITQKPVFGAAMGLVAGLSTLFLNDLSIGLPISVLVINIVSFILDKYFENTSEKRFLRLHKPIKYSSLKAGNIFKDLTDKAEPEIMNYNSIALSKDEILTRIEKNEVFGFGGAAYPAIKKIKTVMASDSPKKYLIINGVECDPGLIHDKWLLRNKGRSIAAGAKILSELVRFDSVTLAVKDTDGLEYPGGVRLYKVSDHYPIGAEKILIKEILGIVHPYGKIPSQEGVLVLNVQTLIAIHEAVSFNKKVESRYLTVANLKTHEAKVAYVNLGANIQDAAWKVFPGNTLVFKGGGIMQASAAGEDDVVDSSVNSISISGYPNYKESPQCSKCGECRRHCPAGLEVDKIARLMDEGRLSDTEKLHAKAKECINCGSCSYVCRAGRNLSLRMQKAKLE